MTTHDTPPAGREPIDLTTADGLTLRGARALPAAGKPKGAIVLVHGYAEHGGRYARVLDAMAAARWAAYAVDLRGHGRSDGPRAVVDRFDAYADDLEQVVARARAELPDRPVFVVGVSLGGLIAMRHAFAHQAGVAGLVALSPTLSLEGAPRAVEGRLMRLAARIAPETLLSAASAPRLLWRDGEAATRFAGDPLCYAGRPKAAMVTALAAAADDARARLGELALPLLAMHGEKDRLAPLAGSHLLNTKAGSPDRTLITWPALDHDLFEAEEWDEVLNVALSWLNAHYVAWLKARDAVAGGSDVVLQPADTPPISHH